MDVKNLIQKIRGLRGAHLPSLRAVPDDLFLGLVIIFVAFGSFGLGRLSRIEGAKTPIRIENAPGITADTFIASPTDDKTPTRETQTASLVGATSGELVGSKNGTKYHYPWCAGAQKIAEVNRIYFSSKADAEAQGYTPASNCKGL
ncbi:MAG: hypothetical protein ACYCZ7_01425 [Minisyncoccota bacterium]